METVPFPPIHEVYLELKERLETVEQIEIETPIDTAPTHEVYLELKERLEKVERIEIETPIDTAPTHEVYLELKERLEKVERIEIETTLDTAILVDQNPETRESLKSKSYYKSCTQRLKFRRGTYILLSCVIAFVGLFTCLFYMESLNRELLDSIQGKKEQLPGFEPLMAVGVPGANKNYMNIGLRQDYLIQECKGSELKQSFPDMGYSLLGYNLLRGYPLSVGHDPGFTIPIFAADYSEGKQTADCRYSVPRGVFLESDVACDTSFSSKVAQTRFEFASSLLASAHVSGGGWGLSFSASAGYKESSSQITSGESVFIISTASCTYYFSKLLKKSPPILHPVFVKWLKSLADTDDKSTYLDFFDTFGTHFPTMVTYGARFTYQHKMASSSYESLREKGINVAVQASYSGLVSVGGGIEMDSSERESESCFSESVETKTITVGAPPPSNGDAMTWVSEVKTSPIPVSYDLESIENLFTYDYMEVLPENVTRIVENIKKYKYEYCQMLKTKGETNSCEDVKPGIELKKTRLYGHFKEIVSSLPECIDQCLQNIYCSAITYCTSCSSSQTHFQTCYLYRDFQTKETVDGSDTDGWVSNVFLAKIKYYLHISGTAITGTSRSMENPADKKVDSKRCHEICEKDANCVAFSYCKCPEKTVSCKIYDARNIHGLVRDTSSATYFVTSRADQRPDTSSTTVEVSTLQTTDTTALIR